MEDFVGWKLIYTVGKSSACAMIEILECVVYWTKGFEDVTRHSPRGLPI